VTLPVIRLACRARCITIRIYAGRRGWGRDRGAKDQSAKCPDPLALALPPRGRIRDRGGSCVLHSQCIKPARTSPPVPDRRRRGSVPKAKGKAPRWRQPRKERAQMNPDERRCAWCGATFEVKPGPGRPRLYCSAAHRYAAKDAGRVYPPRPARAGHLSCAACGGPIARGNGRPSRWHPGCRPARAPRPAGKRPERTCEVCGKTYRPSYQGQRTCSRAHGVELRRRLGTLTRNGSERRKVSAP
jgi:hypothetical protein